MNNLSNYPNFNSYKFGDASLNTFDRTLSKNGEQLEVFAKTFDLLLFLIRNAGEIVTKEEILDTIWSESFVEEQNLVVHISKLRKVLKANKSEPYIKTIKGKGYQFVASVEVVSKATKTQKIDDFQPNPIPTESIAILPLKNENGDEEIEYLADGLTESLINSLSFTKNFKVSARDSVFHYKNTKLSAQDIGESLGVATVLTGRLKVFKDNLIIGVELVNVSDGTQIWGTQINQSFSDIFIMQEKLTIAISEKLKPKTIDAINYSLPNRITENTESYRLYLKGKHYRDNCGYDEPIKAIKCFEKSISEDHENAHSYIGLADSYYWSYMCDFSSYKEVAPFIYKNLSEATKINPNIPELYLLKGSASKFFEWDFCKAEENFQKAIKINPNFIEAYYNYAHLLIVLGHFQKAEYVLNKTNKLTSISSNNLLHLSRLFNHTGQYEKAISKLEEIFEFEPTSTSALTMLSNVYCSMGKYKKAIKTIQRSLEIQHHYAELAKLGYAKAKAKQEVGARKIINELIAESKVRYIPPTYYGIIYTALGEKDLAFEALEQACEQKEADLPKLKIDPRFATLKDDPRFDKLLKRIGLI